MKGFAIFSHSVGMVVRNWKEALQIALLPMLVVVAAIIILFVAVGSASEISFGFVVVVLATLLVSSYFSFGIVVNWHRFIILEIYPQGWWQKLHTRLIFGYIGRCLLLALLFLIGLLPILAIGSAVGDTLVVVVLAVASLIGSYLFFRLCIILPSGAVEKPLRLKEAWQKTKGEPGVFIALMIVLFLANIVVSVAEAFPVIGPVISGLLSLTLSLVNVSVLTTLYGHYVEGRDIA